MSEHSGIINDQGPDFEVVFRAWLGHFHRGRRVEKEAEPPTELMGLTAGDLQDGGDLKHTTATVKEGRAHSPTGYPLIPGVPGSLVGDKGTAPMTNFTTTWVLWYPQATKADDPDEPGATSWMAR
jgi:hypothetical protein